MKKYYKNKYDEYESIYIYYVGRTDEIKAVYNSMLRAYGKEVSDLCPMFCDRPQFSAWNSVYAICVNVEEKYFQIVNSDTIMLMIIEGSIEEVKA